ncbi:MAG TPA: hypothetical protein PKC18_05255 [Lacipirellulaceae bacterium]|nr:hypothetical protein [Lacipirellulaceae bacterium]
MSISVVVISLAHERRKLAELAVPYLNENGGKRIDERRFSRTHVDAISISTVVGALSADAGAASNAKRLALHIKAAIRIR